MASGIDLARPALVGTSVVPAIDIAPVDGRADLAQFLAVPARVHAGDPAWVPPLLVERRHAFDRARNPFFRHADTAFWIARRDGQPVGRISAQIDRRAPPATGWFGSLSAIDDPLVMAHLLHAAEHWLGQRGVKHVLGPFNLSINQEAGLLIDGFATPPMLLMGHDPPWIQWHLESAGYRKAKDLLAYLGPVTAEPPWRLSQFLDGHDVGISLRPLRHREYAAEVRRMGDIFNDAWRENWGFLPFAPDEIADMATQMRPLLRDRLVWFAEIGGEPVGFIVCLPNLNEAIRDLGGRLLPLGWLRLLWRLKVRGVTTARIPLMGIRRQYSRSLIGSRLAVMLIEAVRRECLKLGIRAVETSWILEDNLPVTRIIKAFGGKAYKTYRVYEKTL